MKVFISWSGDRSLLVARALRDWLPRVIQAIEPWLSETDIGKGSRWEQEIGSQLDQTSFGIICLTPGNLDARWINFEAGALSKSIDKSLVCTYLLDLKPTDIEGPLSQFNHTLAELEDTRKLIHTISRAVDGRPLGESIVNDAFDLWWPRLEERLKQVENLVISTSLVRTDRDLLEEILSLVRTQESRAAARADEGDELILMYLDWIRNLMSGDPSLTSKSAIEAELLKLRQRADRKRPWGRMLEEYLSKSERGETDPK